MKIIEFNHKTVTSLLKKGVEKYWSEGREAWLKFTDGSIVCIHPLKVEWNTFVTLSDPSEDGSVAFHDDQSIWYFHSDNKNPFTSRIVSIYFDTVKYYYHTDCYDYVKREYLPVIEFHYYEKGEDFGGHNS